MANLRDGSGTNWLTLLVRTVHLIRRYRIMYRRTHDVRYLWGLSEMQYEAALYLLPEIMGEKR